MVLTTGLPTHIGCAFDQDLSEVDYVSLRPASWPALLAPSGEGRYRQGVGCLNDPAKHVVVGPPLRPGDLSASKCPSAPT